MRYKLSNKEFDNMTLPEAKRIAKRLSEGTGKTYYVHTNEEGGYTATDSMFYEEVYSMHQVIDAYCCGKQVKVN